MKLSFMSFLFPQMPYRDLIGMARKHGYYGIEYRAEANHKHGLEIEAGPGVWKEVRRAMADAGLETSCVATGVKFCSPDKADRDAKLDRLFAFVDLTAAVGCSRIRIFGDPLPNAGRGAREENYRVQAEYIVRAADRAHKAGVKLCLETHSNFRAFDAGELLFRTAYHPGFWVNWHLEHCLKHGEDVDEAYRHVKGRVAHAHFSFGGSHIDRQMQLLAAEGFGGFFSVEVMPKEGEDGEKVIVEHVARWRQLREQLGV
jgi:sugar phosphate isomerase/epimerase